MAESKTNVLILMLMGIVILLMVAIIGLSIRMNQLQREVLAAPGAIAGDEDATGPGDWGEGPGFHPTRR